MLPTPDISHLTTEDYHTVYEPAEDSFLLLDALEKEQQTIKDINPLVCLEVGSGSGVVSTFLAKMLQGSVVCFATDLNPRACLVTKRTAEQNRVDVNPLLMDLAGRLLPRLQKKIDVLIFNPPYVVTPSEEVGSHGIEASWAGGVKGREVTDRFLPEVPKLLSDNGVFYLVVIEENNRDEIAMEMGCHGIGMSVVMERRSGPEKLAVLKFTRRSPGDG